MLNVLWVPVIDFITHGKYGRVNRNTILILSASMPFIYANNFLWTINFARGALKMIFYIFFITCLINIISDLALIPLFGAEGAATGYLIAIFIQFVLFKIKTRLPGCKKIRLRYPYLPHSLVSKRRIGRNPFYQHMGDSSYISFFLFPAINFKQATPYG